MYVMQYALCNHLLSAMAQCSLQSGYHVFQSRVLFFSVPSVTVRGNSFHVPLSRLSVPPSLSSLFQWPTVFAWRKVAGQVLIEWLARFEPLPVTLAAHASTPRICLPEGLLAYV
jgi:hypothetical protein